MDDVLIDDETISEMRCTLLYVDYDDPDYMYTANYLELIDAFTEWDEDGKRIDADTEI